MRGRELVRTKLTKSKRPMLDSKRRELELPRRSALKMRRGGKRRQLRGVQSLYKEGEEDLREKPQARHSLRRLATCQWVAKAQERFQGFGRWNAAHHPSGCGICQGYRVRKRTRSRNLIFETSSFLCDTPRPWWPCDSASVPQC